MLDNRAEPTRQAADDRNVHTLLVVDDDVNVLASLHRLFRRDGYRVLTAASPAEGFEVLALHHVQVILCDQRMPVMSGIEFLSGQGNVPGHDPHHPVRLYGRGRP